MIKAIFFDIDGTLFSHTQNKIPDSTLESLSILRQKGIKTIIATGRHKIDIKRLPVKDIPFDGYLTLNGQLLLDENLIAYASTPIDEGEMQIVACIFKTKKVPMILVTENDRYINYVDDTVIEVLRGEHMDIPPIKEYANEKIYQAMSYVKKDRQDLLDSILDECSITSWNPRGIDIIPLGGGKANGVNQYIKTHNLKIEETMAFGDGDNDEDMLKCVGVGVAMGNGSIKAKQAADYITSDIDDDGVKKALEHFKII